MEGELGESEKSLLSLIKNVPGIVYRCEFDKDWTMRYLSESCSDITGYEPSELIDNKEFTWGEIIHSEDRDRVWEEISESVEKDEQYQVTYRINTKGGEEKWVYEQGNAIKDQGGNIEELQGFITDITEKIREQKKLEEREKKTKELYEASTKLANCRTKQDVYKLAVESAEKILDFYSSALFIEKNGILEVKYSHNQSSFEKGDTRAVEKERLMARSFKNKEGILVDDFESREGVGVTQEGLKSGISVPIGDIGLLVAPSKKKNYFDDFDLEMAKILASHIKEAIERIESEKKLEDLYRASTELEECRTKQEVYEKALQYAKDILDFYASGVFIKENDYLVGKKFTEKSTGTKGNRYPITEGIKGLSFRNKEAILIRDQENWDEIAAYQEGLKSGLSVPIGDKGVFQTVSKEVNYYDEFDLEMAKILASHIYESIERIESEKEKSLILETAEEHILYLDTDLNIEWANQGLKEYSEYDKDVLIGEKCHEVVKDRSKKCEDCPVVKAINSGKREEGIQKDEDGRYWLIRATPRLDEDGEVEGVVEIALDITKRKRSEKKLKENKEKIEGLLESTSQLERQHEIDDIYKVAIDAIENILKIDFGAIFVLEDDEFVLKAETSSTPSHDFQVRDKDDGVLGKTFRTKEPDITDDIHSSQKAKHHFEAYKSGISVPIGDFGVFQAMSKEEGHFDEDDLNMLELLSNHISEARKRVKLHEELERSEKRYRSLFEESPISIWEEDFSEVKRNIEDLKESGVEDFETYFSENPNEVKKFTEMVDIKDVNKTTLEVFGAESKEELYENFDKILREEGQEGLINELVAIANGEQTFQTSEFVNYTLDGEKRYFYLKWAVTSEEEGDYSEVIVSLVDITRLKKTQKKLEKSEKKYRSIFENTGTAMVMIDEDKTISLVNEEFAQIMGYSKEEIEGNIKWPKFVAEKDRDRMINYHHKRRESPGKVPSNYEFTIINRFGDIKHVVIEVGLIPEAGKTVASLMDITEYKKTFGALRESQEAFRLLFENIDDPVILIDKDRQIKDVNNSFRDMLESEEEDIIDKSYEEFLSGKTGMDFGEKLEKIFSGKEDEFKSDVLFITGEKTELPMNIQCELVKDHEETPLYVIGILRPA
ncbi:MAG: PAS domain S-box protein [Candidatus Thermoplasmatota archaeon]